MGCERAGLAMAVLFRATLGCFVLGVLCDWKCDKIADAANASIAG